MKSYADLAAIWRRVDEEVASTPMPEEYACWVAHILYNDCKQVQEIPSSVLAWERVWAMMRKVGCLSTLQAFAEPHQWYSAISSCLILEFKHHGDTARERLVTGVHACRQDRCHSTYWALSAPTAPPITPGA